MPTSTRPEARAAGAADPAADAPVRVVDLAKSFGRTKVLRGISIAFPRGKTTVVLGPSGCGKSVMLKHIIGLLRPDKGQVYYESERVDRLSERRLAPIRREFGFLFQHGALFDSMTVRDNVAFPLRELEGDEPYGEEDRVRRVLRLVGLEDTLHRYPSELSGGQRKRIALARAIVLNPKVILYDEPTTGLDPIRSDVINELILKLKQELGVTSIVVTHDLTSAFKVADHMVMLHEGHVVLEGPPSAFRESTDGIVSRFLRGEASDDELRAIRSVEASNLESVARGNELPAATPTQPSRAPAARNRADGTA
jgi:phospholipid/cholesterol/gamma-HCH transport system ATP-binding protein